MSDRETLMALKRIERLLTRIADRVAPVTVEPVKSAAAVASMMDTGADVPSQIEHGVVKRGDRYHRVTWIKGDR